MIRGEGEAIADCYSAGSLLPLPKRPPAFTLIGNGCASDSSKLNVVVRKSGCLSQSQLDPPSGENTIFMPVLMMIDHVHVTIILKLLCFRKTCDMTSKTSERERERERERDLDANTVMPISQVKAHNGSQYLEPARCDDRVPGKQVHAYNPESSLTTLYSTFTVHLLQEGMDSYGIDCAIEILHFT